MRQWPKPANCSENSMPNRPGLTRREAIAGVLATAAVAQSVPANAQADAMKALVAAAKAEGSVTVAGPPVDECRNFITKAFLQDYGITVTYDASPSQAAAARIRSERAAGRYLIDVFVSGSDTPLKTFMPSGWLDKVEGTLVAPDVIDPHRWRLGHLLWMDPQHYILRVLQYATPEIAINTKLVKPGELTKWRQLLDPKWKGKIVS